MRNAYIMGKMQAPAQGVRGNQMPQFPGLRRLPMRYQYILPLAVMKLYRCAVIGSAQGVLTVALADRGDTPLVEILTMLTGRTIFPVWVKPSRLRLLIRRRERWQQRKDEMLRWPHPLSLVQIHAMVTVPVYQIRERK
jgi:hypothetical protein